jgi:hypothetical protein
MSVQDAVSKETERSTPEAEVAGASGELAGPDSATGADDMIQLPAGSLAYDLVQKLRALPYDKQRELMDFVQFLQSRTPPKRPRRSLEGMLAHLNIHITSEDIAEARREMWGNFPREFSDE